MAMLEAHALSKWYGPHQALQDCDLQLEAGETVGFLGPNGAGKSTTMNILAGVLAPSSGTVRIAGLDPLAEPLRCRQNVGYLPQQQPLYMDMRVSGYLDHVARLKRIPAATRRREVVDALAACDLHAVAERRIRALSGGNRQRVALAQALLGRPPLLILDEPTAGLDPTQVHKLRGLLEELSQRHSILLSTHIMAEVEATCSRVIIINRGRILLSEPIAALRERSRQHQRLSIRLMQPEQLDACRQALQALTGVQVECNEDQLVVQCASDQRQQLIDIAQDQGGLRELVELRRSLEDVFTEITEEPQHA